MAATACSLVQRSSHRYQRLSIPLVHIAAGAFGGGFMGLALGALGAAARALEIPLTATLVAVAIVAATYDLLGAPMRRIQPPHGVPGRWRAWHPLAAMGVYGLVLGAGLFTPFTAAAMYALAALVMLIADPLAGGLLFAAYGAMRAVVSMSVAGITMSGQMGDLVVTLQQTKHRWRPVLAAASALAVAFLLLAAPRS